ncbi:hypothetical protein [uncultured Sphingomonas sp.]|uniref:hypothetical protein n=1 Tax=uncultured Sphingomonas sp. TaxID=158754 RepID=UPI002598E5AC|nr:hypothetical protein [uncultured Sphingomonas sp.]
MAEKKTTETAANAAVAADLDTSGPANIAPAEAFSTSGAPVQIVPGVDPSHPAIDNNPRAGTTVQQNAIDMNDPTLTGPEAVAQMLERQKAASSEA